MLEKYLGNSKLRGDNMEMTRCLYQSIKNACMNIRSECYGTSCEPCDEYVEDDVNDETEEGN
jgi:hypothetical protein